MEPKRPPVWFGLVTTGVHNYCEQWVVEFNKILQKKLNEMGHKFGLSAFTNGAIKPGFGTIQFLTVPGGVFSPTQQHSTLPIVFKDGTVFYVDVGTLASGDINNLSGGPSNFTPADAMPPNFYPADQAPPSFWDSVWINQYKYGFKGGVPYQ